MPIAPAMYNPETTSEFLVGARTLDAEQYLDPHGTLRAEAFKQVADRLAQQTGESKRPDPMTDVLGAGRLLVAAKETGLATDALRKNLWHETKTGLMEAVQAEGYISRTRMDVAPDGRAHIGDVYMQDLILRGIHPGWAPVLNEFGEIDLHLELMSQAMFKDAYLRNNYHLVQLSLLPTDRYKNYQELRDYGFRPDTKKWVIDDLSFEPNHLCPQRLTDRLFLSGSNVEVANELLQEEGRKNPTEQLTTTEVRRRLLLVPKARFAHGAAVGLGKRADQLLATKTGLPVFCGKPQAEAPADAQYATLLQESIRREREVALHVEVLSNLAEHLAADRTLTFEQQNQAYGNAFIRALRDICTKRPEYAEHAFGLDAAWLYSEAKRKRQAGDIAGSDRDLNNAFNESTEITMCNLVVRIEDGGQKPSLSIYTSLHERYPGQVMRGKCISCGKKRDVGPCGRTSKKLDGDGICHPCEITNEESPGKDYIVRKMAERARPHKFGRATWLAMTGRNKKRGPAERQQPHGFSLASWQKASKQRR